MKSIRNSSRRMMTSISFHWYVCPFLWKVMLIWICAPIHVHQRLFLVTSFLRSMWWLPYPCTRKGSVHAEKMEYDQCIKTLFLSSMARFIGRSGSFSMSIYGCLLLLLFLGWSAHQGLKYCDADEQDCESKVSTAARTLSCAICK